MNEPEYRDYIKALVDQAPPLTTEQKDRLGPLLQPGVEKTTKCRKQAAA